MCKLFVDSGNRYGQNYEGTSESIVAFILIFDLMNCRFFLRLSCVSLAFELRFLRPNCYQDEKQCTSDAYWKIAHRSPRGVRGGRAHSAPAARAHTTMSSQPHLQQRKIMISTIINITSEIKRHHKKYTAKHSMTTWTTNSILSPY